jgi:hypothetical protein
MHPSGLRPISAFSGLAGQFGAGVLPQSAQGSQQQRRGLVGLSGGER